MKARRFKPTYQFKCTIELTESEARALSALAGYGDDAFLKIFYEHMGKHYLRPHEHGLKTLFENIRSELDPQLLVVTKAEKALLEATTPRTEVPS